MTTLEQQLQEAVDCYEQDHNDDATRVYKEAMKDFLEILKQQNEQKT